MPSNTPWIQHVFGGGWATDYGPSYYGAPGADGKLHLPFLVDAKNVQYEFDGGPHKCPGTTKLNSATIGATTTITGLYDYWRQGTAGTPTQKRICHAGTVIYKEDLDGAWDSLFTGMTSGAVPHYNTFDDLLIIASDNTDVPKSWDQTTAQSLAGTPPRFSFSATHKNYCWAAGNYAFPSRLYYSVPLNPEDWVGAGSGSIDINPGDGDMITGIISHGGELVVFKGPNKGSIHRITGSSATDFAKTASVRGIPAAWINSIFQFGSDLGWISSFGSVHSFNATNAFGDYTLSYYSYPIGSYVRGSLNQNQHRKWWAVNNPQNGHVLMSVTASGQTNNTICLMMDYRFLAQGETYPRWALWDTFSLASLALIKDTNQRPRMFGGGYTGYAWKMEQDNRTNDGSAINMQVTTPYMTYGAEWQMKTLEALALGIQPKNNNAITIGWSRDNNAQQTDSTLTQGQNGGVFDTGTFGTATFGGNQFVPRYLDMTTGGEFRSVQYQISDTANNSDLELHQLSAKIAHGAESLENP